MDKRAMIKSLQEKRAEQRKAVDAILEAAQKDERTKLTDDERAAFDAGEQEIRDIDARIAELDEQVRGDEAAEATRKRYDIKPEVEVRSEPLTYQEGSGHSYFLDLARMQLNRGDGDGGVSEAVARLKRHGAEMDVEFPKRERARQAAAERDRDALDREVRRGNRGTIFEKRVNPNRTDGQGGYFVPPLWLVDDYIDLPRFGRTFANTVRNMALPAGTDSINVPKVATGTATGVQTADAGAVTSQDLTDTFVNAPVRTIAGQQDVALQLLDQSPVGFDEITFADLIADYNALLDTQCWNGSGSAGQLKGILNVAGINAITYTDATPTLPELYLPSMQALSQSARKRKMMPSAVFLTPQRWFWMASQLDSQNRPFILPETQAPFNPLALQTGGDVEGPVGRMLNFPLLADGNIPQNLGAGTNEDRIATMRTSDLYLWEGSMRTRVLTEILSGTLQVRFQVYNYAAFMPDRRPETISVISGTGLIGPTGF
ncbi:phage major capsid protein, HK97 family [Actinacidiphila alni]|uniref:Phage major capsid protein, HK97 family n=1 Tax=Actinacidiphila alni TaxID=380248 RepID=A0A1I2G4H4_9ACTN|nr:phage major capsid protein [Actinacidiphila alni]SFF11531.1 phage major capsid protein, HK97 family [Actinacidiphila alni]